MLEKFIFSTVLICLFTMLGFAQKTSDDDYQFEAFNCYVNNQTEINNYLEVGRTNQINVGNTFEPSKPLNGFKASTLRKDNRYFRIKSDFSALSGHTVPNPGIFAPTGSVNANQNFAVKASFNSFLRGQQITDNGSIGLRFNPFERALGEIAFVKTNIKFFSFTSRFCSLPGTNCTCLDNTKTGFAAVFSEGLDNNEINQTEIDSFEGDYNPPRINGKAQSNVLFESGLFFADWHP